MGATGNPLLHAALYYAGTIGWAVFPCKPGTKVPLTQRGFKDASRDPEIIRAWWAESPNANIGVPTGAVNAISALDIDVRNGVDGNATMAGLEKAYDVLPNTAEQSTPSGGRHLLFRHNGAPVRNTAGKLGAGLDTRGDGGYIVAAPSIIDGKPYHWLADPGSASLPEWPQWLLELLAEPARKSADATGTRTFDGTDLHPYIERVLRDECANVALAREGTRNHT